MGFIDRLIPTRRPRYMGVPIPNLNDGLIAYYKMEESSGSRLSCAPGAHNRSLMEGGSGTGVGFTTGKVDNGAQFADPGKYLQNVGSIFDFTGGFTISVWLGKSGTLQERIIVGKGDFTDRTGASTLQYAIYFEPSPVFGYTFTVQTEPTTFVSVTAIITSNQVDNLVAWLNVADSSISLSMNNETPDTATITSVSLPSTEPFTVSGAVNPWDGMVDELGIWDRPLSSTERLQLYLGGTAQQPPFIF